jgi:GNAT superfamily N-acetyltransferase
MNPDDLRTIAHRALAVVPSPLLRLMPRGRHEIREGVTLYSWAMPGPSFNKAAVFGPAPPLERVLALAGEFFGGDPSGFGVMVEADAGHPIEAELRSRGWTVLEDEPALVMPALTAPPPCPAELEVCRVTDEATHREFARAVHAGFAAATAEYAHGAVPETPDTDSFYISLAAALDPDIALMVGRVDGQPVSTALMFRTEETACITGVATVPAYRRRGYGKALTWAVIAEGAARGCRRAALNALGASYPLYLGMGFQHVCNHRTYAAPTGGMGSGS